jgi:hypothetical protein
VPGRLVKALAVVVATLATALASPAGAGAAGGPALGTPEPLPAIAVEQGSPFTFSKTSGVTQTPHAPLQAGDVIQPDGSVLRNGSEIVGPTPQLDSAEAQAARATPRAHAAQAYGDVVACYTVGFKPVKTGSNANYQGTNDCDQIVSTMGLQVCAAIYSSQQEFVILQCDPSATYYESYITDHQLLAFSRACTSGRRYRTYTYAFATYNNTAVGSDFSASLYC